jgi:hypothetical protein
LAATIAKLVSDFGMKGASFHRTQIADVRLTPLTNMRMDRRVSAVLRFFVRASSQTATFSSVVGP